MFAEERQLDACFQSRAFTIQGWTKSDFRRPNHFVGFNIAQPCRSPSIRDIPLGSGARDAAEKRSAGADTRRNLSYMHQSCQNNIRIQRPSSLRFQPLLSRQAGPTLIQIAGTGEFPRSERVFSRGSQTLTRSNPAQTFSASGFNIFRPASRGPRFCRLHAAFGVT
jgi:hypothetical protein